MHLWFYELITFCENNDEIIGYQKKKKSKNYVTMIQEKTQTNKQTTTNTISLVNMINAVLESTTFYTAILRALCWIQCRGVSGSASEN